MSDQKNFNGHSMVGPLLRVMVFPPKAAGWGDGTRWKELGFLHAPDLAKAQAQHDQLCDQLKLAGAEVIELKPCSDLTLDAVYTHDASLVTDYGLIVLNPGKPNRVPEAKCHGKFAAELGIPVFGEIESPGIAEAGDMVWLNAETLLVGYGYRSNATGISQMRALLAPKGIEVISAPLPYGNGPAECLHLMSLISLLDKNTAVVDLPWLAVETVELLKERGYRLIDIDYGERASLACNVLALGKKRLLAIEENVKTNQRLRDAGFDVLTFSGSELCVNGSGGPTCLTRPLLRG